MLVTLVLLLHFICAVGGTIPSEDLNFRSFNSNGEVKQFHCAAKAIDEAPAVICYKEDSNSLVLLAAHDEISPLLSQKSQACRFKLVDSRLLTFGIGYQADCKHLLLELNRIIVENNFRLGSFPSLNLLSISMANYMVHGLYEVEGVKAQRPFGATIGLCSIAGKDSDRKVTLVGNTGTVSSREFFVFGRLTKSNQDDIESILSIPRLTEKDKKETKRKVIQCLGAEYKYYEEALVDYSNNIIKTTDLLCVDGVE